MKTYVAILLIILCSNSFHQMVSMQTFLDEISRLWNPIERDNLETVKFTVKTIDTDEKVTSVFSPLVLASFHGHSEIVPFLTDSGANNKDVNFKGETGLFFAAANGHDDIPTKLLSFNTNCTIRSLDEPRVLIKTAKNNHSSTVEELSNSFIGTNAVCQDGCSALLAQRSALIAAAQHDSAIRLLIEHHVIIDTEQEIAILKKKSENNGSEAATVDGALPRVHKSTIKMLLDHGIKLLKPDGSECLAFDILNDEELENMLEELLEKMCVRCYLSKTRICLGCMEQQYCSDECQKSDWPNHKTNCSAKKKRNK